MKNILAITIATTIGFTATFTTTSVQASDPFLTICEDIKADDKTRLRRTLKDNKIKIRSLPADFTCNGKNIFEWALANNANTTAEFIISKTPKKSFASNGYAEAAKAAGNAVISAKISERTGS